MESAGDENASPNSPWYLKCIEYLRNRNRVSPGKVTLPDCDFFIVGPRRTLRVLRPALKSGCFYESLNPDRPDSINDNFFSRWSRRPHPSGNCRCSYRRSGRLSTPEEQIISDEIQRIRTSLCKAEKTGQDIQEIEQSVSRNLENLRIGSTEVANYPENQEVSEKAMKERIVKDLDKYINDLLEEILNDTVKILSKVEANSQNKKNTGKEKSDIDKDSTLDISFAFYDNTEKTVVDQNCVDVSPNVERHENIGYVNPAFVGSECDPETLDFHHLQRCKKAETILSNADCVDSGINSVETVELEPEQQPSLEQSLMEIIDSKLGKSPFDKSLEDLNMEIAEYGDGLNDKNKEDEKKVKEVVRKEVQETRDQVEDTKLNNNEIAESRCSLSRHLEDLSKDCSFGKIRLEFKDADSPACTRNVAAKMNKTVSVLRDKLVTTLNNSKKNQEKQSKQQSTLEIDNCGKNPWQEADGVSPIFTQTPKDFVVFRKNRKPMIVFLHGFGSTAEVFENQLNYFSNLGYPCIAPDMLGHGMSSAPNRSREYQFEKLLEDFKAILYNYAFNSGQKCVLVGHNYGCSFATALASKFDVHISQLVLISGGGPTPLAPPSTESAGHCFLRALLAPFLMCGLRRNILYSARGRQHPYCGPEPKEQWPSHMKYVLSGMLWPDGDYVFHRRICTPTLLIHGLRDNRVSLVQECQMERTMVKAFLEAIPTAGHTPMTDCPEQLNHMIHCFIDLWKNKKL